MVAERLLPGAVDPADPSGLPGALLGRVRQLIEDLAAVLRERGQLPPQPLLMELAHLLGQIRRILPQHLEAEEAVVGGVLFSGRAFVQVAELLQPGDFYDPVLRVIYEAMIELDAQSRAIDILTVAAQLKKADTLSKLTARGGEAYLVELSSKIATVENIAHHAHLVREKATARQLIEAASRIMDAGYAGRLDADQYVDQAQRAVFDVAVRGAGAGWQTARQVLHATLKAAETRYERARRGESVVTGVPTRFGDFDVLTAGLQPEELIIIAGRPSMGKTAFVMNCAMNAAAGIDGEPGFPVLVFSLEMGKQSLMERLICSEARVQSDRLRTGNLLDRDWVNIAASASRIAEAPLLIDDRGSPTLMEIRSKCRRWRADPQYFPPGCETLGMVVIDYLQLIAGSGRESREREVSEISRGLKALAKELHLPVVALSQLSRECEKRNDKRPMASDLRESGQIEADADLICFVYRDEVYNKESPDRGIAEIIIGKQRNGPTDTVRLTFLREYTRFENLSTRAEA